SMVQCLHWFGATPLAVTGCLGGFSRIIFLVLWLLAAPSFSSLFLRLSASFKSPLSPVLATDPRQRPVSPLLATLPKTPSCNPFVCHTCDTPRGVCALCR